MSVNVVLLLSQLIFVAEASVTPTIEAFKEDIALQEYKSALKKASAIEEALLDPTALVAMTLLPEFWLYRGLAYWERRKRESAMNAWRQAIRTDIALLSKAEGTGVFSVEQLDIIAALTQEIRAQHEFSLDIPKQIGEIQYFIDGRLVNAGSISYEGRHLLQVNCPSDPFTSVWLDSLKEIDWLSFCPSGMGESKAPAIPGLGDFSTIEIPLASIHTSESEITPSEDHSSSDSETVQEALTEGQQKTEVAGSALNSSGDQVEVLLIPRNDLRDTLGLGCMIGGGALLTTGTVLHFVTVRPRYQLILSARTNPSSVTRTQADQLSSSFNAARWTTIALLGTGVALSGSGAAVYFTSSEHGVPMLGSAWVF